MPLFATRAAPVSQSSDDPLVWTHTRRRVHVKKVLEINADAIPTTTPGHTGALVDLASFTEVLLIVYGYSMAGTASGLTVALQKPEPFGTTWYDVPGASPTITIAAGTALQGYSALSNFGGLARVRVSCSTNSFTGGILVVLLECKT